MLKPQAEASPVTRVAAGDQFSLAVTMSGSIYAWGLQADGRLGTGSMHKAGFMTVPERVHFPDEGTAGLTKSVDEM